MKSSCFKISNYNSKDELLCSLEYGENDTNFTCLKSNIDISNIQYKFDVLEIHETADCLKVPEESFWHTHEHERN